jgi:hypothetical protein
LTVHKPTSVKNLHANAILERVHQVVVGTNLCTFELEKTIEVNLFNGILSAKLHGHQFVVHTILIYNLVCMDN